MVSRGLKMFKVMCMSWPINQEQREETETGEASENPAGICLWYED